jgi:transcriptional regulator with XRE-family HTH domain
MGHLKSYLRPLRRRVGFTQDQLARLVGVRSRAIISDMERLKRWPTHDVMLIYALIFDTCTKKLFPTLMSELHEAIVDRATELYEEMQGKPDKATRQKLDFLEELLARMEANRTPRV